MTGLTEIEKRLEVSRRFLILRDHGMILGSLESFNNLCKPHPDSVQSRISLKLRKVGSWIRVVMTLDEAESWRQRQQQQQQQPVFEFMLPNSKLRRRSRRWRD